MVKIRMVKALADCLVARGSTLMTQEGGTCMVSRCSVLRFGIGAVDAGLDIG